MNIKECKVGQPVWVEQIGIKHKGSKKPLEQCIEEWTVTYVGRKYIKAVNSKADALHIEVTFEQIESGRYLEKADAWRKYALYATKQEFLEWHERDSLFYKLAQIFRYRHPSNFSLEQLKRMYEIAEIK